MVGSERKEEVRRRTGGGSKKKTKPRDACYYKIKRLQGLAVGVRIGGARQVSK